MEKILQINSLTVRLDGRTVLEDINIDVNRGEIVAILGPNGGGKTTLIKILTQIIRPDKGTLVFYLDNHKLSPENLNRHIGLIGPYLQLYQELTAYENLRFISQLRRVPHAEKRIKELAAAVGLERHIHRAVHTYSSGMKQRLKYLFAIMGDPDFLFVDEPTSNLDKDGISWVYQLLDEWKRDKVLVFATNDEQDLNYADEVVTVVA